MYLIWLHSNELPLLVSNMESIDGAAELITGTIGMMVLWICVEHMMGDLLGNQSSALKAVVACVDVNVELVTPSLALDEA